MRLFCVGVEVIRMATDSLPSYGQRERDEHLVNEQLQLDKW